MLYDSLSLPLCHTPRNINTVSRTAPNIYQLLSSPIMTLANNTFNNLSINQSKYILDIGLTTNMTHILYLVLNLVFVNLILRNTRWFVFHCFALSFLQEYCITFRYICQVTSLLFILLKAESQVVYYFLFFMRQHGLPCVFE